MKDDFDDGPLGLPDDEMAGGSELPDLDSGGEVDVEIDLGGGEPAGRLSGGARAVSRKASASPRKSAPKKAPKKAATKKAKKPAAKKKTAKKAKASKKKARKAGAKK